jgi:hypothetical protein
MKLPRWPPAYACLRRPARGPGLREGPAWPASKNMPPPQAARCTQKTPGLTASSRFVRQKNIPFQEFRWLTADLSTGGSRIRSSLAAVTITNNLLSKEHLMSKSAIL